VANLIIHLIFPTLVLARWNQEDPCRGLRSMKEGARFPGQYAFHALFNVHPQSCDKI